MSMSRITSKLWDQAAVGLARYNSSFRGEYGSNAVYYWNCKVLSIVCEKEVYGQEITYPDDLEMDIGLLSSFVKIGHVEVE